MYIFSDRDCVNIVYRGAIVGGTAYAPRAQGRSLSPESWQDLRRRRKILKDGSEGKTLRFDSEPVTTNEAPPTDASGSAASASGDKTARVRLPVDL